MLGIIPLAFVVALLAAVAFKVSVLQMIALAAIVGVLAIIDACCLNPPIGRDRGSN